MVEEEQMAQPPVWGGKVSVGGYSICERTKRWRAGGRQNGAYHQLARYLKTP